MNEQPPTLGYRRIDPEELRRPGQGLMLVALWLLMALALVFCLIAAIAILWLIAGGGR